MKIDVVIGAGWGDEGKGRVVSELLNRTDYDKKLVVRFNGGHQAGHTVVYEGKRHVFSNFGSGTLQGVPTYWSKHCTVYPISLVREYFSLTEIGIQPKIYIDPLAPLTTPYDLLMNRLENKKLGHGTCGVGFGTTIGRHQKLKVFFTDIFYPTILKAKLANIHEYYDLYSFFGTKGSDVEDLKWLYETLDTFWASCEYIRNNMPEIRKPLNNMINAIGHIVFEGAQGILLDQDYGFFPNVTRSYTTSRNAVEFIMENISLNQLPEVDLFYVTRPYHTRHGNGFMVSEEKVELINNEQENNVTNKYQGNFRIGPLAMNLLDYALEVDCNSYRALSGTRRGICPNLLITCTDQLVNGMTKIITKVGVEDIHISKLALTIAESLPIYNVYCTHSPEVVSSGELEVLYAGSR